jgi:hypothetical protein
VSLGFDIVRSPSSGTLLFNLLLLQLGLLSRDTRGGLLLLGLLEVIEQCRSQSWMTLLACRRGCAGHGVDLLGLIVVSSTKGTIAIVVAVVVSLPISILVKLCVLQVVEKSRSKCWVTFLCTCNVVVVRRGRGRNFTTQRFFGGGRTQRETAVAPELGLILLRGALEMIKEG